MTDWATISSLATASGTLVLAAATFVSVRSGNRSARVAELSLMSRLRPLLLPTQIQDPEEKVGVADRPDPAEFRRRPGTCTSPPAISALAGYAPRSGRVDLQRGDEDDHGTATAHHRPPVRRRRGRPVDDLRSSADDRTSADTGTGS
jgi:hypothetical protein